MPDIEITDTFGKTVDNVSVNPGDASSLFKYLKSELMHLIVLPDLLDAARKTLTQAAPQPSQFQLKIGHRFQLGNTRPEVDITPTSRVTMRVNASPGTNLFTDDPFAAPAQVPSGVGYVALALAGSLDLGIGGSAGDLSFGMDENSGITVEYLKAFGLGANEPTLGDAMGRVISTYVIPADVADLKRLEVNDICTVSGHGRLTVSGSFDISAPVNPLASVQLPLGVGTITVKDGVMAGLATSLSISGSYQVRARKADANTVELGFCKQKGSSLNVDLSASAGVQVNVGSIEVLSKLIHAINPDKDENDKLLNGGLTSDEATALQGAIKSAADRSLQASLDLALLSVTDDEAAFQYQVQLDRLDAQSSAAVHLALDGDLSRLTALEAGMKADGTIAAGVKVLKSCFSKMRQNGASMKVNLLGIVNVISLSEFVRNSTTITDPVTGDLTITDSAIGNVITAISEPPKGQEALRKAMFESVMVTTAFRAGKTVDMPALKSHNFHFALNQNTNKQTMSDYLNWFVALRLLDATSATQVMNQFIGGGQSTCLLRTEFDDKACQSMFFDAAGNARPESDYLEIGRKALAALIDPKNSDIDRYRYGLLTDTVKLPQAIQIGPVDSLAPLLPLNSSSPIYRFVLMQVEGDVYDIAWWASSMNSAAQKLQQMRHFLKTADPATLAHNNEFASRRADLQKHMAGVVAKSKARFQEPWGLLALSFAAGAPNASGRLVAAKLILQRTLPQAAAQIIGT